MLTLLHRLAQPHSRKSHTRDSTPQLGLHPSRGFKKGTKRKICKIKIKPPTHPDHRARYNKATLIRRSSLPLPYRTLSVVVASRQPTGAACHAVAASASSTRWCNLVRKKEVNEKHFPSPNQSFPMGVVKATHNSIRDVLHFLLSRDRRCLKPVHSFTHNIYYHHTARQIKPSVVPRYY